MTCSYSPSDSDNECSSLTDAPGDEYSHSPNQVFDIEHSPSTDQLHASSSDYSHPPSSNGYSLPADTSSGVGYNATKGYDAMTYLEVPRMFYPSSLCVSRPPTPQFLTTYNPTTNLTNTLFNLHDEPSAQPHVDMQTIVVSCSVVETTSLGIFFGPDSKHNFSLLLDDTLPHSASEIAAETFAVHKSLKLARNIANVFGPDRITIMKIIIVTSSAPVVKAMTQWVGDCNEKDSGAAGRYFGGDKEHGPAFERLDRLIENAVDQDGLEVELWLVGPEGVVEAKGLAKEELAKAKLTKEESAKELAKRGWD